MRLMLLMSVVLVCRRPIPLKRISNHLKMSTSRQTMLYLLLAYFVQLPLNGVDPSCTSNPHSSWNIYMSGAYCINLTGLDPSYASAGSKGSRDSWLGFRLVMLE